MIFVSQLLRIPIVDSRQEMVGRVKDVVVRHLKHKEYPEVTGIVFEKARELFYIQDECIESYGPGEVTLTKFNCWTPWNESDAHLFLSRDVLDQQIFDVKGIRVVRVNDLQLVRLKGTFHLFGIDISTKAILRRIGFLFYPFDRLFKGKFIDWNSVSFIKGNIGPLKLRTGYQKLKQLHPADIANLIENLTHSEGSKVVQAIDKETAAEVLVEVEPKYKDTLLEKLNNQDLAKILERMSPDDAADVLQDLSEEKRTQVFRRLSERKAKVLTKLSDYQNDIAGGLMTTDYFVVKESMTVADTVREIGKKNEDLHSVYHVFVVDEAGILKGVVSIRTLLFSKKKSLIKEVMSEVLATVGTAATQEEVARLLTKYNLLSAAVVDEHKKFLGAITVDDVMRRLVPEA